MCETLTRIWKCKWPKLVPWSLQNQMWSANKQSALKLYKIKSWPLNQKSNKSRKLWNHDTPNDLKLRLPCKKKNKKKTEVVCRLWHVCHLRTTQSCLFLPPLCLCQFITSIRAEIIYSGQSREVNSITVHVICLMQCNSTFPPFQLSLSVFPSHSGQRTEEWSSAIRPDEVTGEEKPDDDAWRPVIGPGEVTITDVTLNSLTVTFRESRVPRGFFREWGRGV